MPNRESHRTTASGARNADVAMRFARPHCAGVADTHLPFPNIACPIQIRLDQVGFRLVARKECLAGLESADELRQTCDRTREHRLGVAGQRRAALRERQQGLLE